jgi:hypothetical protein
MRAVVFSIGRPSRASRTSSIRNPVRGRVLLKRAGAGACHADVAIYKDFAKDTPGSIPPPYRDDHVLGNAAVTPEPHTEVRRGRSVQAVGVLASRAHLAMTAPDRSVHEERVAHRDPPDTRPEGLDPACVLVPQDERRCRPHALPRDQELFCRTSP